MTIPFAWQGPMFLDKVVFAVIVVPHGSGGITAEAGETGKTSTENRKVKVSSNASGTREEFLFPKTSNLETSSHFYARDMIANGENHPNSSLTDTGEPQTSLEIHQK